MKKAPPAVAGEASTLLHPRYRGELAQQSVSPKGFAL